MRIVLGLALSLQILLLAHPSAVAQEREPRLMPGTVGKGPLGLISSAAATYQEYFADACPQVLAVDAAGWATHASLGSAENCPAGKKTVTEATIKGTLNTCDSYADNPPCSVVAIGRKVVWDGPIRLISGEYTPRGDNQFSVVLRKTLKEEETSPTFETSVGLITYSADGRSGEILFKRNNELGLCRGSLSLHGGESGTVALTCTKAGTITGTVDLDPGARTGSGTAAGSEQRQFELAVLPHAEFIKTGTAIYEPVPDTEKTMTIPEPNGAS